MKKTLPILVMEKILKKAGSKRVSEKAKQELQTTLEKKAKEISSRAQEFAEHAGRKTVKKEDIKLVIDN